MTSLKDTKDRYELVWTDNSKSAVHMAPFPEGDFVKIYPDGDGMEFAFTTTNPSLTQM
jgi:hypothetical protein